jgi:ATP-binding protein involved in chromosome partitioning
MRYAVPVTGGKVATHFGHCSHFALFDVDEARKAVIRKEIVTSPGHQPGVLPAWLAEEGVSVVIASGIGSRAQGIFRDNRIEVIIGVLGDDPEEAVLDHIKGTLATGDNICDH